MRKLIRKSIALILIIIMTSANLILLGEYTKVYALSDEELINQDSSTNHVNVEFNAYLENEVHSKTFDINSKEAKIYLNVKVKESGYIENGTIEFNNVNFKIKDEVENENIQSVDVKNNKIVLNKLNNGSDTTIELPIEILVDDSISLDHFNKETTTKFTAKYVDGAGKENAIEKEVINKISWKGSAEAELSAETKKFVPFATEENYGVMVQTKVNSKVKDASLPIKNTNIELTVPLINNVKPTTVNVISTNMLATNGKSDGIDFTKENYSYDVESGKVVINTSNLQDRISWNKNDSDEYLVTFIYEGKEIYDYAKISGMDSSVVVSSKLTLYNSEELIINKNLTIPAKFTESVGTVTDFALETPNQISKGFIYANYDNDKKTETEYFTKYIVTVSNAIITKSIEFIQKDDKFVNEDGQTGSTIVNENNLAYNKKIEVSQKEFNKILGEEGTITIKNDSGEILGTINKECKLENGVYSLDISSKNNNKLDIITSAPITEGQLKINIVKALNGNIEYSKEQMKQFTKMKIELEGKTNITTFNAWNETLLKEPETKVELEVSKKDLTTVIENENVEIRAVLDTSNEYNALFENTTLNIILPSCIENIELNSANILLGNGLIIKNSQVKEENGQKVIYVELEGKQKEYTIDAEYKGTIVVLNTDINVETLTPSSSAKIVMEYSNKSEVATNSEGTEEQEINFVAPNGIVAASGISNYKQGAEDVLTISDEQQTVEINTYSEKRIATMKGIVINNYQNEISNVVILGRIPAQGNKKIDTETELGSTFTIPLASNITISDVDNTKYTIYYSDNTNATKDLTNQENGWTTTQTSNSKSFLIVFNDDYKLNSGSKFDFQYDIEIPEKLAPNNNSYSMYKVYYTNNSEIGSIEENKNSAIIGITTGKGPELEVELSSTADKVREGQTIKMKATIKNVGEVDAENIVLNAKAPEYVKFVKYLPANGFYELGDNIQLEIGNLKVGESINATYYIKIDNDTAILDKTLEETLSQEEYVQYVTNKLKFPKEIINTFNITVKDLEGEIQSNECRLEVLDGNISIDLIADIEETQVLRNGNKIRFISNVTNISGNEVLSNTIVTINLPKGIKYNSGIIKNDLIDEGTSEGITYDEANNILNINVGNLEINKIIEFELELEEIEESFSIMAIAKADNIEEQYSNKTDFVSEKINLKISELTSTPKYVKEGEIITYNFTITNNGNANVKQILIQDELPEEVTYIKTTYIYNENEIVSDTIYQNKIYLNINQLNKGESINFNIEVKANKLLNESEKKIQNKVLISASGFDIVETNTVENIIEYNENIHTDGSDDNETTKYRYKITGTAWIDENKDGKRDNTEQILSNTQVILLNKDGKTIVKDADTNENKITTTNSEGEYEFNNLLNGEYLVLFIYDSSIYSLTEYQKSGVDSSYNSDAIDINIIFNGEKRIVGITDIITIDGENVRDIDIGVYASNKFDLKLDKYINKITLTTPTIGTKVNSYNNTKIGKVEVLGQNLGKSNAVIEYKIVIKNEGSVPGYVSKIVDYLPDNISFTTELNKDWYLSENGNIYNASLANEKINPGESKEVILIASMKITENNLGIITNNAEIYESYNELGLKDIDSTEGNKEDTEDDISKAEVIVSIVTGKVVMYTLIAFIIISMLALGAYNIKKYVLNNKKI